MTNWISVGKDNMLQDGTMQEVQAGKKAILLARIGQAYYATQAQCPHLRARLVRGTLDGNVVTCTAHGSTFDLTTGRNLAWIEGLPGLVKGIAQAVVKPKDLATFPVKVEDGQVWVDVDEA